MATARHAAVDMTYNGKSAAKMAEYLTSFKYTDVASASSDSISVELSDRDKHWIGGWFPQKGDRLIPTIVRYNWNKDGKNTKLKCGTFIIDDFSFSGNPLRCTIEALALPSTSGFKATERTCNYEKTTLKGIGKKVAKRAGLSLYFEPSDISIASVAQDNQTDCSFYNDLVVRYGYALKIYNDKLVVFDEAAYEAKTPVATLSESDFEPGWTWNTTLAGTYTGVNYQYTHSGQDKTYTVKIGSGSRILSCSGEASNQTEATAIALAALNNANKNTTTMKITLRLPARSIMATDCVRITGLGQLSGKYYVEQAETTVSDGTKESLSLRKVETRFKKQQKKTSTKTSSTAAERSKQTTTFKKGDKVRVVKGAKDYSGKKLASFVYTTRYTVIQVGGKNLSDNRIVIGLNGVVTAAVKAENLYKA